MKMLDGELSGSPTEHGVGQSGQSGVFALTGEYWSISYGGRTCSLKNLDGFKYLQQLLERPGEEFRSVDLLTGPGDHSKIVPKWENDPGPVLDAQSIRIFKRRLDELAEELEEVRARGAVERAEEIENEIDEIKKAIKDALKPDGRSRRFGTANEKARINVTRAIRAAIQRISEHHAELGEMLENSIRTGSYCRYQPDPERQVAWSFERNAADLFAPSTAAAPAGELLTHANKSSEPTELARERTAFVGRTTEREVLRAYLDNVLLGAGAAALISGPPGIGKTRLSIETAREARNRGFRVFTGNCYDREDSVPFIPLVEMLELGMTQASNLNTFREDLGSGASEFTRLMPQLRQLLPEIPPPLETSPELTRRALFNATTELVVRQAAIAPLLLLFEDVHWADAGTLGLIAHLARSTIEARVMIVVTYRDDELDAACPLAQTLDELTRLRVEQLRLTGLPQAAVGEMLEALSGRHPATALVDLFYANTEGNPLFVEELFNHVERSRQERDALDDNPVQLDLPHSLRLVIRRRLLRVSAETRKVLATAAVIGRSFTFMLFEAATGIDADRLVELIEEAERAGLISSKLRYPDVQFKFSHELIRRAVIDDLSIARRQRLHVRVADAIERLYPESLADHAEDLAHHRWNAGVAASDSGKTVRYLQLAGMKAMRTAANAEAIGHLRKALQMVESMPDSPERVQTELMLQVALSVPVFTTKGFASPELEKMYARVRHLSRQAGESPELFPVAWARWLFHTARGEHITGRELAEQCLRMAERAGTPALRLAAHHALGVSLSTLAEFEPALEHLEETMKLYNRSKHAGLAFQFGQDFGVVARSHAAIDLWYLGYPERGRTLADEAVELARKLSHPHSLAAALVFAAWVQIMSREAHAAAERAEEALRISSEGDFGYWRPIAGVFHGWTLIQAEQRITEGIAEIEQSLAAYRTSGAGVMRPAFLALLAESHTRAGQPTKGLEVLRDAYAFVKQSGERWWEPELYRLEGELTRGIASTERSQAANDERAEERFQQAIEIAREQHARLLELRATVSLARLWNARGKGAEARKLVEQRHGWFREGFAMADLLEAAEMIKGKPASRVA